MPTDNPVPWVTDNLRGCFVTDTEEVWSYARGESVTRTKPDDEASASLLNGLTTMVSALHNDDKPYQVVVSKDAASAGTLMDKRVVEIGSKPYFDGDLSDGQKAATLAGLALHEVGHIRHGRGWKGALTRHFGKDKVTPAIATLSNLAADCHDETRAMSDFPGLAPTIPVALWWVGGKGNEYSQPKWASVADRVNEAIAAVRYPENRDWSGHEAWLDWWSDWAERATNAHQPKQHAAVVDEAIQKCRAYEPEQPDTGDEPGDEPNPETGEDDSQAGQGSASDEQPDQQSGDETGEGERNEDAQQGEQGSQSGDEPGEQSGEQGEDEADQASPQGGVGDIDTSEYDERKLKDPCPMHEATDWQNDHRLQQAAETAWRGQREGLRKRVYRHRGPSMHDKRPVIAIPWKGGKWGRL